MRVEVNKGPFNGFNKFPKFLRRCALSHNNNQFRYGFRDKDKLKALILIRIGNAFYHCPCIVATLKNLSRNRIMIPEMKIIGEPLQSYPLFIQVVRGTTDPEVDHLDAKAKDV